ncbi:MAG: RNA methyltransferase [Chloroflexi bacterium]|nr:RNA methyltransferase [Chloroflexota bacterium]
MSRSFEIRVCQNPECGLRYPLMEGHPFGMRCPHCLGETQAVLKQEMGNETLTENSDRERKDFSVLLDNIRSAWNVGSILRSADGFGFRHAYLCGITPTPEQDAVKKTSLGAEDYVTWSYHKDAIKLVKGLKREGWKIIALEEHERALPISQFTHSQFPAKHPTLLIAGSEVTGVDPELLELADDIYYIPMFGQKRSFNVAVAFGVASFSLTQ